MIYRAKTIECNSWVYGYYVRLHDHKGNVSHRIYPGYAETDCGDYYPDWDEVDPKTVGAQLPITDKDGNEVFQGDIVQYQMDDGYGFDCQSVIKLGKFSQDGSGGEYTPRDCFGYYADVSNFTCPDWAENEPDLFPSYRHQESIYEIPSNFVVVGNIYDDAKAFGIC